MSQDYTTTALLASLKRRGMLPSNASTFSNSDFLDLATEEMQTYIMALLLGVREEYAVSYADQTLVSGQAAYSIPSRAVGQKLKDVQISNTTTGFSSLTRIEPPDAANYGTSQGTPSGYMLQDDSVILLPTPGTGTLRLHYFARPSKLVLTSAVATIASINGARTVVTTSATIPGTMTSGVRLDIVDNDPGFRGLALDQATTGTVSGTTVTFATALPASVQAGDYVCLAGTSPVPQIPVELHPLLAQRVVVKALEALTPDKVATAKLVCDEMRAAALVLLTPRAESSARIIVNKYAPGFGRRGRR